MFDFRHWFNHLNETTEITTGQDLFHATPFLREIESQGFKSRSQTGISTFGSGGYQDENTVSVTPSYENALKYAKALKLIAQAAQGLVEIADLPGIFKIYRPHSFYFEPRGDALADIRFILEDHGRPRMEALEIANQIVDYLKTEKTILPEVTSEEKAEITTVLIKGLGTHSDGRFPWIITKGIKDAINKFKNIDIDNVGIVTVQLKTNQTAEYIKGEQEFRIPPENLFIKSTQKT